MLPVKSVTHVTVLSDLQVEADIHVHRQGVATSGLACVAAALFPLGMGGGAADQQERPGDFQTKASTCTNNAMVALRAPTERQC